MYLIIRERLRSECVQRLQYDGEDWGWEVEVNLLSICREYGEIESNNGSDDGGGVDLQDGGGEFNRVANCYQPGNLPLSLGLLVRAVLELSRNMYHLERV